MANGPESFPPLNVACRRVVLPQCFSDDAEIDVQNGDGRSALLLACTNGHQEIATALLEAGATATQAELAALLKAIRK